jgi:2-polyprenyl-6-hydroxyphenyl methylase / 3-demethylubiquinone-9 3-methyltransferase
MSMDATIGRAQRPTRPRARNDPAQYDELADEWWKPGGAFAGLRWLAVARAALIPPMARPGAVLLDVACGGGLLGPHLQGTGYKHVGVDLSVSATRVAREHGMRYVVRGDVNALPFRDEFADVVVAGEILEHVPDLAAVVGECCRVLRPGGTLVVDTIADTRLARVLAISLLERVPGGAPRDLHDPALLVHRRALLEECARRGVRMTLTGLWPSLSDAVLWLAGRRHGVRMLPIKSTAVLFQGVGIKEGR